MSYPVYGMKGLICVIPCVWYERVNMSYPVYGKKGLKCHNLCMVRKG